jgi:hypothetical protein
VSHAYRYDTSATAPRGARGNQQFGLSPRAIAGAPDAYVFIGGFDPTSGLPIESQDLNIQAAQFYYSGLASINTGNNLVLMNPANLGAQEIRNNVGSVGIGPRGNLVLTMPVQGAPFQTTAGTVMGLSTDSVVIMNNPLQPDQNAQTHPSAIAINSLTNLVPMTPAYNAGLQRSTGNFLGFSGQPTPGASYPTGSSASTLSICAFSTNTSQTTISESVWNAVSLATWPASSPEVSSIVRGPSSPLSAEILARKNLAALDFESQKIADAAADDAMQLIDSANLSGSPRIMYAEDGILALQWQKGDRGVALVFAGDGLVSIAFRRPGRLYAENGLEISISEPLPAEFISALAQILE